MEKLAQQSIGYLWSIWLSIPKLGYEDIRIKIQSRDDGQFAS
jgi:hypothetical protein